MSEEHKIARIAWWITIASAFVLAFAAAAGAGA